MTTEDFVTFPTARLLKEKGFNTPVTCYYNADGTSMRSEPEYNWNVGPFFSKPTLQTACKWLREEKKYFIDIHNWSGEGYTYEFVDLRNIHHLPSNNCCRPLPTYEEACEEAIKYCLERLV